MRKSMLPWGVLFMILIMIGFLSLAGCAMLENFVRGMAEGAGIDTPEGPMTAASYIQVLGGLGAAILVGGLGGKKLSDKFGKWTKVAKILSAGLYKAKKTATTERINDITNAVGDAAEDAGVKKHMDKLYETIKGEQGEAEVPPSDPTNPTNTAGLGTNS